MAINNLIANNKNESWQNQARLEIASFL